MLNNEAYLKTSAEVCTQIASYFDVVDSCIALADTNHQYSISPQTSYSPSPPIPQGSYTSVIISPNSHNTADIYNGFIKADLQVTVRIKDQKPLTSHSIGGHSFSKIWFGFKDARDAIEKYELVFNGNSLYTQNYGCEESFLTACCSNEVTKRADVYSKARHKDVWNNKAGTRCGVVIDWKNSEVQKTETIHLKIDLRRFLPLSNIKYLPAFAGKVELRLYFSCAGMVYCPLGPEPKLQHNFKKLATFELPDITNEFTPIGEPITCWTKGTGETSFTLTAEEKTFDIAEYKVTDCLSIIPCFGINDNIYNGLVQRYSNPSNPLTFPTQTIAFYPTSTALKNSTDKATITVTPSFVDSIFCLFPLKHTHRTYFKNPKFDSFYINAGGYGNIPSRQFGTTDKYPEFLEYCQNAMNMNGEQIGFNKEVVASLCNMSDFSSKVGNYSSDRTSFFIGLPTETDNTYQQGLTSVSPINFEINVKQDDSAGSFADACDCSPLICFLIDASISFLVQPNGMPTMVRMGNYDLTTPE